VFGATLLGVYVILMIHLVRRVGTRIKPSAVPYAILLISLALVAQSYWLQPAIAYHQFLPLLFGTAILLLLDASRRELWRSAAVGILASLAGLAYISGAALILIMGSAYVVLNRRELIRDRELRSHLPGLTVLAAGIATMAAQLYLVTRFQGSLLASSSVSHSAYPWNPRFWAFYLGEIGRSIGLTEGPVLLFIAIGVALLATPVVVWFTVRRRDQPVTPAVGTPLLFASILPPVYCAFVAFGRATNLPESEPLSAVLQYGAARFHFWWAAAMIPLLWLGWHAATQRIPPDLQRAGVAILVVVTMLLAVPKSFGGWHYPDGFAMRVQAFDRNDTCIASNLVAGRADFTCAHASSGDIGPLIARAYEYDLAFVHQGDLPPRAASLSD
jgi:hypothetical protein